MPAPYLPIATLSMRCPSARDRLRGFDAQRGFRQCGLFGFTRLELAGVDGVAGLLGDRWDYPECWRRVGTSPTALFIGMLG